MLDYNGLMAGIEIGGEILPCHDMKTDDTARVTSCYIASESNANFTIVLERSAKKDSTKKDTKKQTDQTSLLVAIAIDGFPPVDSHILTYAKNGSRLTTVTDADNFERALRFGELQLTGTISISVHASATVLKIGG